MKSAHPLGLLGLQLNPSRPCFFIPSNAYLKQIKVILPAVKKYRIFFTSDRYDLYFFTVANRGCFDNLGLNFFQKRSVLHCSCLTLRYGSTHDK